jgi:YD repeat-containing protein
VICPSGEIRCDANNHTTSFGYDGLDRLSRTTYPDNSTERVTYDADNNVLTRQTRAGQTITFTYDTLNRLSTKTPPSPAPVVSYGYDLAGHQTRVSDTSAAVAAAVPPGGSPVQYAASYAYDAMNHPTSVSWNPAPTPAAPTASNGPSAIAITPTTSAPARASATIAGSTIRPRRPAP